MKIAELLKEASLLGQGMSKAAKAADVEQSDREYIAQRQMRDKFKPGVKVRVKGSKNVGTIARTAGKYEVIVGFGSTPSTKSEHRAHMRDLELAEALDYDDEPLTEGFWAVTNKYRLSDDPRKDSKNGEDFLSLSGDYMRPGIKDGSPRSIESLNALLTASKGEVTDEVLAWNGSASIRKWLKWVKENGRRVKRASGRYVG